MSQSTQLEQLFETFIGVRNLRPGTVAIYDQARRHLAAACAVDSPAAVTPLAAQEFSRYLQAKLASPASVNIYLRAVKAVFNWAVEAEILQRSPFKSVKAVRDKRPAKDVYRGSEMDRLLAACPDDRWRLIVALALTAGLRRGDILNLTVAEVDYIAGVIEIREKTETALTWRWDPKDTDRRKVPITPLTESLLLRLHAELPAGQPYLCLTERRYLHLIAKRDSGKLTHNDRKCPEVNFLRSFAGICRRAGVAYKTFHALRGSCLTHLADNGLPPHQLQALAGHADYRTTNKHYIRPDGYLNSVRENTYNGRYRT